SSNVFSNFEQTQIQEFKEAFTLIDQNRDGFIDKEDLKDTYASLGKTNVKDDELESMLKEATGPINFTMFLNLFGEKLSGTDTEETILNAFKLFDPDAKGNINKDYMKRLMMSQGQAKDRQAHAGVERKLCKHESVLFATVPSKRMQCLDFMKERSNPYAELEDACKKDGNAANLNGFYFIVRLLGKLAGQLISERQSANKSQRKGIKEGHESCGFCHMEEERMMDKPEKTNGYKRSE
ncbi:Myosin light chain 5, partial [Ophiophagus hannah]